MLVCTRYYGKEASNNAKVSKNLDEHEQEACNQKGLGSTPVDINVKVYENSCLIVISFSFAERESEYDSKIIGHIA